VTYLELVNQVLVRLREDEAISIDSDDPVVRLAKAYVNDAKRWVEESHQWNSQRIEWMVPTIIGEKYVSLPGAGQYAKIEQVLSQDHYREIARVTVNKIRYNEGLVASPIGNPRDFAVDGVDTNGDIRLRLFPTPEAVTSLLVGGYRRDADLVLNSDTLNVPHQPVIWQAYGYMLRERGETGGMSAAEAFAIAATHLSDAVAHDAALNDLDNDWYVN